MQDKTQPDFVWEVYSMVGGFTSYQICGSRAVARQFARFYAAEQIERSGADVWFPFDGRGRVRDYPLPRFQVRRRERRFGEVLT